MVNFKFLAHFLVDHLAYPVVSSLILLLCEFLAFAYYYYYYYYYYYSLEFFTAAYAGGLSQEIE